MGSFNLSDPFVGSIRPGDACVLIILERTYVQARGDAFVSTGCQTHIVSNEGPAWAFTPVGAIHGTYNDYGRPRKIREKGSGAELAKWLGIDQESLLALLEGDKEFLFSSSHMDPEFKESLWGELDEDGLEEFMSLLGLEFVTEGGRSFWESPEGLQVALVAGEELKPWKEIVPDLYHERETVIFYDPSGEKMTMSDAMYSDFNKNRRNLYRMWCSWSNTFPGFADEIQDRFRIALKWGGMWILKETWEALGGSALPSDEQPYDSALHALFPCGSEALLELGFTRLPKKGYGRYDQLFQLPGWETDEKGKELVVPSDGSFIGLDGIHYPIQLASYFEKRTGRRPDFSNLDIPVAEAEMRIAKRKYAARDGEMEDEEIFRMFFKQRVVSLWREVFHSQMSSPMVFFYLNGDETPLLWRERDVEQDFKHLSTMTLNLWRLGRMFFPSPIGPQCGDLMAEEAANRRLAKISHDRLRARARERLLEEDSDLEPGVYNIRRVDDDGFETTVSWDDLYIPFEQVTVTAASRDPLKTCFIVRRGEWFFADREA